MVAKSKFLARWTQMLALSLGLGAVTNSTAHELNELEDRQAIVDILTQYSYRWDSKDSSGFAELFTKKGILERWNLGELVQGSRIEGKQAIFDYAKQSHEGRLADRQTRHHFSGIVFLELSKDSAVTQNMALITHQTSNDTVAFISSSGIYRITWQKTPQGWLMNRRVLMTDSFR